MEASREENQPETLSGDGGIPKTTRLTIFDLRGSIPASGPQDFEAVRDEVMRQRAKEIAEGDKAE